MPGRYCDKFRHVTAVWSNHLSQSAQTSYMARSLAGLVRVVRLCCIPSTFCVFPRNWQVSTTTAGAPVCAASVCLDRTPCLACSRVFSCSRSDSLVRVAVLFIFLCASCLPCSVDKVVISSVRQTLLLLLPAKTWEGAFVPPSLLWFKSSVVIFIRLVCVFM